MTGDGPAALSARQAYDVHVEALRDGDIDRVLAGYAPDAVMIANGDVHRGREAMRPLFERSRSDSIIDSDLATEVVIEGGVVYVSWRARRPGPPDLAGADTFVVADGLISVHTGFYTSMD